jgi:hypothetical protein
MQPTRRVVRIEYRVRPDVDLDALKQDITGFVDGIRALRATSVYTSYQDVDDPRHFVHVGEFDTDAVPELQAQEFFKRFSARQKERCVVGPDATKLAMVASTR